MNEEQINQAIAKACGKTYHKPTEDEIKSGSYYQYEPNYYRSLDAMHEAEKVLTSVHWHDYWKHLEYCDESNPYCICFATAAQRAEAFLKTIGLWK